MDDEGVHINIKSQSDLVEGLVLEQRLDEASEVVREMLVKGTYPTPRVFKFLLYALSRKGEVEKIASYEKYIDEVGDVSVHTVLFCIEGICSAQQDEVFQSCLNYCSDLNPFTKAMESIKIFT